MSKSKGVRSEAVRNALNVLRIMKSQIGFKAYVDRIKTKDKLRVLISIMLSARTKDELTEEVSERLFSEYSSEELCKLKTSEISKLIYPVGFYKTKAKNIKKLCVMIKERFKNRVPNKMEDLLKLPGVGRKTANLYLAVVHGEKTVCVDTHVHRISNRLGIADTKTPFETENALKELFPKRFWPEINRVMVPFGKSICKPVRPNCSVCNLKDYCNYYKHHKQHHEQNKKIKNK